MEVTLVKSDGVMIGLDNDAKKAIAELGDGETIKATLYTQKGRKRRTQAQNSALHLFFEMLAEELNNHGLDMKRTLKQEVEIPWTKELVKEYLWRPIQQALIQQESTTDMNTCDPSYVYDQLMKHLGEKFGIYVPFPSIAGD